MKEPSAGPKRELARRAVRGTVAVFAANSASRLIALGGTLYLMARVGAAEFGVVAYAAALLAICDAATNWGFAQAAVHRRERVAETFSTFLMLRLGLLLGALAVLGAAAVVLRKEFAARTNLDVLAVLALATVWDAVSDAQAARLSRALRFGRLAVADVASVAAGMGVAVALAAWGWGMWALVANRAVGSLMRLLCLAVLSTEPPGAGYYPADARWLLRFSLPLWFGSLATTWVLNYDDLVVGELWGKVTLGHYDRAYGLAILPLAFVTGVLTRVSFPLYARLQGDRGRLSEAFRIASGATLRLAAPISLGLALAIPDVLAVLGWRQWEPIVPILRWLLVYAVARPLMDDAGGLLTATGQPKVTGYTLLAEAAALLVLCPVLAWHWGAEGAATSVGLVVLGGLAAWYGWFLPRVVDIAWWRMLAAPVASLGLAAAAGLAVSRWGGLGAGWAAGAAKLAAVAVAYAGALLLLDGRGTLGDLRKLWQHGLGSQTDGAEG